MAFGQGESLFTANPRLPDTERAVGPSSEAGDRLGTKRPPRHRENPLVGRGKYIKAAGNPVKRIRFCPVFVADADCLNRSKTKYSAIMVSKSLVRARSSLSFSVDRSH